jgi:hypothetical protein
MTKRSHVNGCRLAMSQAENTMPIKGRMGTAGVLKARFRSGRVRRKIIIEAQTIMKAERVPMLTSSATTAMGVKPATAAVTTPMIQVGR